MMHQIPTDVEPGVYALAVAETVDGVEGNCRFGARTATTNTRFVHPIGVQ